MVFTASNLYRIQTARLDALQLVLTGTALELSVFLFEIPTGVIADVVTRKLSIILGTALIGIGFIVEAGWTFFSTILLAQVLWGVGFTFTSGAIQAWITDEIGEEQAAGIFLQEMQVSQLGALLGTACGAASGAFSLTLPMRPGGATFLLVAVALVLLMPETGFHPAHHENRSGWQQLTATFRYGLKIVGSRTDLQVMLGIGLFFGLYSEGFDRLGQAFMLDKFQFPTFPPVVWFGLIHLLRFLIDPLLTGWINRGLDSQVRATMLSMRSQVDSLGQIGGGPLVGWIALRSDYRSGLQASALLLSPVLLLFFFLFRKIGVKNALK